MTRAATLRIAAGSGHVARRDDAVLFIPAGDERLVRAFTGALPGAELRAVASAVVESGFDVPAFVAVTWTPQLRVMAFGDIAVETDQPTLPMLSGAGSRTWVEHTLEELSSATIDVQARDVDPLSDLAAGVALAGGFRLELNTPAAKPAAAVAPDALVEPAGRADAEPAPAQALADVPARDRTEAVARPEPAILAGDDDATAALAAIQSAAMTSDGVPLHSPSPVTEPVPVAADDAAPPTEDADITIPPAEVDTLLPPGAAPPTGSLVEAKLCPRGHPNPPAAASCAVCGDYLAPGTAALVNVVRPSLGRLELDDRSVLELDAELLIGRHPERDTEPSRVGLQRVRVAGEKVSRSHLEVRFQGWDVLVADCDSTNGTFIVPHPGGQVATLQPGRPQMVEEGAVVYFGSRSFTVQGRGRG
jgi:hypothetical protein